LYIPKHYLIEDEAESLEFMRRYSFATIVTAHDERPTATHLPFVVHRDENAIWLTGHFARANPQWKHLERCETLVIFQEPHAYISPTHYDSEPNVPTWNYVAVHAYGRGEIIEKPEAIAMLIVETEPKFLEKWNNYDAEYRRKLFAGIVAFRIKVERLEGKKKLNQKSSERDLAEYMEKG
jgi:transcriptional regulator